MPLGHLDLLAVALTLILRAEVHFNLLSVSSIFNVELAGLHVLELWVVLKLLNIDGVTTDEKYTLDLKVWLFAEHAEFSERVLDFYSRIGGNGSGRWGEEEKEEGLTTKTKTAAPCC